ncbi:MAG: hypothetical protein HYX47_13045 [Burkholderiales bacterium]|nr:hypothetical protein [Burkholderiales bacterium]
MVLTDVNMEDHEGVRFYSKASRRHRWLTDPRSVDDAQRAADLDQKAY